MDLKNGLVEILNAPPPNAGGHNSVAGVSVEHRPNPLFADLLNEWIAFRHPSNIVIGEDFNFNKQIKPNTWAGYADNIKHNLGPTFKAYNCTVQEITVDLRKGFYSFRLKTGSRNPRSQRITQLSIKRLTTRLVER